MTRWSLRLLAVTFCFAYLKVCSALEEINKPGCGRADALSTTVTGKAISRRQLPWIVNLDIQFTKDGRKQSTLCCGSIISQSVVLTAAHCFYVGKITEVRVFYNTTVPNRGPVVRADGVDIPAKYKKEPGHDLALVHVIEPFKTDDFVRPVCLPRTPIVVANRSVLLAGWSYTEKGGPVLPDLQLVRIRTRTSYECAMVLQYLYGNTSGVQYFPISCGLVPGKNVCMEDSGAPLYGWARSYWVQVGITTFGSKCDAPEFPIGFTRIPSYMRWIKESINSSRGWTAFSQLK